MSRSDVRRLAVAVLLLCLIRPSRAEAEATWTEVRSPHFRVLTDGSVQQGRNTAAQFEELRDVFASQFNDPNIGAGAPLTIVAAQDADTFRTLEPTEWKASSGNLGGEFHRGWEKQFATVILNAINESQIVVFHEYTHSILHAKAHWLPIWLDEGFAEFYGDTRFEQSRTLIGAPTLRSAVLRNDFLLPVSEPDSSDAKPLTFKSDGRFMIGFSDSFWWGEDHFSPCHHLAGHTAVVAYKPEDLHLLDLEVRDDLPALTRPPSATAASAH